MVAAKIRQVALIACLFLFLFVVIGGGLHLNSGGAFLAATGTPLVVHFFNRRCIPRAFDRDPLPSSRSPGPARSITDYGAGPSCESEMEIALRR